MGVNNFIAKFGCCQVFEEGDFRAVRLRNDKLKEEGDVLGGLWIRVVIEELIGGKPIDKEILA